MKRRALCFLLCVLFCFFSLSLSSSAAGDVYEPTPEDLIDMGYEYIDDGVYGLPSGTPFPFFMAELAAEPQFPDFNPGTDLPWLDMPSYIREIVEAPLEGLTNNESPKVPFILVSFNGSFANIFAGYNLALGSYLSNGTVRIMNCSSFATYDNSVCYTARYTLQSDGSFTITNSWARAERTITGDREVLGYFSSNFANTTSFDFYVYGANMIRGSASGSFGSITVYASADNTGGVHFVQNIAGFEGMNGRYFSSDALSTYWSYFKPMTEEEEARETQKGIWETLKSIPDMIAEKFKGLFIPEEGFFDTYTQEFQDYFKDRFGLLYELPAAVLDILQQFVDYQPSEEGYYIDFPEVVMPVLDEGEWSDVVLIEETKITFDFLDEGPIATLYSMYRSALWLLFIFLLINLIIRKSNKVFGGSSG